VEGVRGRTCYGVRRYRENMLEQKALHGQKVRAEGVRGSTD